MRSVFLISLFLILALALAPAVSSADPVRPAGADQLALNAVVAGFFSMLFSTPLAGTAISLLFPGMAAVSALGTSLVLGAMMPDFDFSALLMSSLGQILLGGAVAALGVSGFPLVLAGVVGSIGAQLAWNWVRANHPELVATLTGAAQAPERAVAAASPASPTLLGVQSGTGLGSAGL